MQIYLRMQRLNNDNDDAFFKTNKRQSLSLLVEESKSAPK